MIKLSYPVYIISKGRWEKTPTADSLDSLKVPYKIVIEPQEYNNYAKKIDPSKILVLPFSNLGQGSIPARNWVWEHALKAGFEKHWIMDDNINCFTRLNRNLGCEVTNGSIFRAMEDFSDRYENMAISGPQYGFFAIAKSTLKPYVSNTRIYSCILINMKLLDVTLKERWRGIYNEDTDLSLRALKAGLGTCLFNAFLQWKQVTMTMKGGNEEIYKGDGRKKMAESIVQQHPDVARVGERFGRVQHVVNYKPFKDNKWIKKKGLVIENKINNYGMVLLYKKNKKRVYKED